MEDGNGAAALGDLVDGIRGLDHGRSNDFLPGVGKLCGPKLDPLIFLSPVFP